jgi:hypothetical protein
MLTCQRGPFTIVRKGGDSSLPTYSITEIQVMPSILILAAAEMTLYLDYCSA